MNDKTLEADGVIMVCEIGTGNVVAQYEGLDVHRAMGQLAALQAVARAADAFTDVITLDDIAEKFGPRGYSEFFDLAFALASYRYTYLREEARP